LLRGDLAPPERERCERHLESCPACQELLDQSERLEGEFEEVGRQFGDPTLTPADPTLSEFLGRLHEVRSTVRPTPVGPADLSFLGPAGRPDLLGTLGAYEVQEVLGAGSMGIVFKAFDPALHRLVAIKVMSPTLAGRATARRRFTREAQAAAAVAHEHIVAVHGVHEAEGLPYLVMQYVTGESLQARLDRGGPLDVTEVVRVGAEAASGLAAAHARGLIHRDIKPANLLLEGGSAKVKITDFGLARAVDEVGLTQSGVVAGTPEYMAPEQARGEAIDHRADLFALGSVLYALVAGRPPFRGATPLDVLSRVTDEAPAPLRTLNPDVPAWLEALVARLLAKDPAGRFPSAAEVAALLGGYLAHLRQPATVPAPELPHAPAPGRGRGGPRLLPALLLGALVLASVGLALDLGRRVLGPATRLETSPAAGDPARDARKEPPRFHQDFRGKAVNEEFFEFTGARDLVHDEPEGLRITLPGSHTGAPASGVLTSFHLTGDFVVTTSYELLHVDDSKKGWGAGASLYVMTGPPSRDAAMLANFVRPDGHFYACSRHTTDAQGKRQFFTKTFPTEARSGKLRLMRRGAVVTYLVADGGKDEFQELHQFEVSADDFLFARIAADAGGQDIPVDVRFHDLDIQSPALPQEARTDAAGAALPREKKWLPAAELAVLGIALGLAAALGVSLYRRRARSQGPAPASGGETPAGPAAAPPVLSFACSACGKDLKARSELAGKKARCRHCGAVVLIPEAGAGAAGGPPAS
jgi:serine/threonine-protein kinase